MYFPDMPGRQSMVIFIAIYQLASKSRVFRHIVVLVSHCGGKFGENIVGVALVVQNFLT